MNQAKEIRPGANIYVSGENVLPQLKDYLNGYQKIVVITGHKSYEVFCNHYQKLDYPTFVYNGSASEEDSDRLAAEIKEADVIIAIGGGRLLDTAKMSAETLHADLFMIPTLISNCAPYAPIVAVYHPDRTFRSIRYLVNSAHVTFVDWNLLLTTPSDYMIAGIGDTLAKWYEIEALTRNLSDDQKTASIRLGIASAKEIYSILKNDSEAALNALKTKKISAAFGRIADTIIALAGTVGGFAADYGRTAGAHSIHNALSYIESTHEMLHGAKVAYGILVQLAYTHDIEEIRNLIPFYDKIGLPSKLKSLNVDKTDREALTRVAEIAASPQESFKLLNADLSPTDVLEAIDIVEEKI